jgi:NAD(P)-dependent dehydrogenase (short-subunit alcohol dehydrogenase family)
LVAGGGAVVAGGGGGGGGAAAALVAGTGAGVVALIVRGDGAALVGDGDGGCDDATRVALRTAVDVARGDGAPFVVLAWAATLISTKKAIPPSAVSTLCRRTHNIHGAGLRGA